MSKSKKEMQTARLKGRYIGRQGEHVDWCPIWVSIGILNKEMVTSTALDWPGHCFQWGWIGNELYGIRQQALLPSKEMSSTMAVNTDLRKMVNGNHDEMFFFYLT